MSLSERSRKARAAALFAKVLTRDKQGRIVKVLLPGSEAKQYEVILRRNGHLSGECNLIIGVGLKPCSGNQHAVCYHVLAAILIAARADEKQVSFCECQADAERLAHTGQSVYCVASWNAIDKILWLAVRGQHAELYVTSPEPQPDAVLSEMAVESRINDAHIAEQRKRDLVALYGED